MKKSVIAAIVLGILVLLAAVQSFEIMGLKSTVSSASGLSLGGAAQGVAVGAGGGSAGAANSLNDLNSMNGGC